MRSAVFLGVLFSCIQHVSAQTPLRQFKQVHYKRVKFIGGASLSDSTYSSTADLSKIPTLQGIQVEVRACDQWSDSCQVILSRHGKLLLQFVLRGQAQNTDNTVYIADLDHDGRQDIKFFIINNGNGLASSLVTKVYFFNTPKGFKKVSFFDFAYEPEYDLNHDGVFEILGKEHTYFRQHSYWVYNLYNFKDGRLINVSREYGYPYWTRFLYRDFDGVPARNISFKDRMTEFKETPGRDY